MLLVLTGRPASGIKIGGVVPSGLGIIIRVGGFLVQTPLCAWLGLGTQPRSEAPTGLGVEITKPQWLTSAEWGCLLVSGPKLAVGQPNSS